MRVLERSILAGLVLLLAGCSPSTMLERMPAGMGGLPAGAPAAPTQRYKYPSVHDMPPPRTDRPLSAEQQDALEKDLQAARKRLDREKIADQQAAKADKKDAAPAKKHAKKRAKKAKKPEKAGAAKNP